MSRDLRSVIDTRLGAAWDAWFRVTAGTGTSEGYLWFVPQGGIDTLTVDASAPTQYHQTVTPENLGHLSREQFLARMWPVVGWTPLLNAREGRGEY
jgi:hypothetical protein